MQAKRKAPTGGARKRGRPKKIVTDAAPVEKRKRGRPKKQPAPVNASAENEAASFVEQMFAGLELDTKGNVLKGMLRDMYIAYRHYEEAFKTSHDDKSFNNMSKAQKNCLTLMAKSGLIKEGTTSAEQKSAFEKFMTFNAG
jgi:hypothetical protein